MSYYSKARGSAEKGSAFVELALFTPALLLMLVGAIDFARVYYADITLANAAEVGALYGARSVSGSSDTAGMQAAATNDGKDLTSMTAVATNYCACGASGAGPNLPCYELYRGESSSPVRQSANDVHIQNLFPIPGIPSTVPRTRQAVIRVQ